MTDPCKWCDGRTQWNGNEWKQMSRCKEEDSCDYYRLYQEQKEEWDYLQSEVERRDREAKELHKELKEWREYFNENAQ